MKSSICFGLSILASLSAAMPAHAADDGTAAPLYAITGRTPMGGTSHWDLLSVDPRTHHVFVSHDDKVNVVDGQSGKAIGEVTVGGISHGIAIVPNTNMGWTDDSLSGIAIGFDLTTLAVLKRVATAPGPDVMIYNPHSDIVMALSGKGKAITAIDAKSGAVLRTLALGAAAESAAIDTDGTMFVQGVETQEILHIAGDASAILQRWSIKDCAKPRGLAIDTATRRLFSSCLNKVVLVTDADTGKQIATAPIGVGTDALVFDPATRRIFSPNGEGTLSVIQEVSADHFEPLASLPTTPGARTIAIDTATRRMFLPAATAQTLGTVDEFGRVKLSYAPGSAYLMRIDPLR